MIFSKSTFDCVFFCFYFKAFANVIRRESWHYFNNNYENYFPPNIFFLCGRNFSRLATLSGPELRILCDSTLDGLWQIKLLPEGVYTWKPPHNAQIIQPPWLVLKTHLAWNSYTDGFAEKCRFRYGCDEKTATIMQQFEDILQGG